MITLFSFMLRRPAVSSGDLNEQAQTLLELITEQMKASEGVTEAMKASGQMAWVGAMNSIRNRAEEIILREMIYEEDAV